MDSAISKANDRLTYVSQDQDVRRIYEMREKALHDRTTEINTAFEKGEKKIIDLLKSGKSPEDIIREYGQRE